MTHRIKNGGLEAGFLSAVAQDHALSETEQQRLDYLESLPANEWVALNRDGMAISLEQADEEAADQLRRFRPLSQT